MGARYIPQGALGHKSAEGTVRDIPNRAPQPLPQPLSGPRRPPSGVALSYPKGGGFVCACRHRRREAPKVVLFSDDDKHTQRQPLSLSVGEGVEVISEIHTDVVTVVSTIKKKSRPT